MNHTAANIVDLTVTVVVMSCTVCCVASTQTQTILYHNRLSTELLQSAELSV